MNKAIVSLNVLFSGMPETTGCQNCESVNGENKHWCCKTISPSMYYVEFLNVWQDVQKWSKHRKSELVFDAIRNYLRNTINKGCIFYKNGCTTYKTRPYSCRLYGIIPSDGWQERIDLGKKRFGNDYQPTPQCALVSTVSKKEITKEQEDKWFLYTRQCEQELGVPKHIINAHDGDIGSYRTFHDHILIELFKEEFILTLSDLRQKNLTEQEIDAFVDKVKSLLEQNKRVQL